MSDFYMFSAVVKFWVMGNHDGSLLLADWLLTCKTVGEERSSPSSVSKRHSHTASLAACVVAIYSASVLERVMTFCFLQLQLMAAPANVKMNPEVDLRSLMSLAQSAST